MHPSKPRCQLGNSFWSAYSLRTRYHAMTLLVTLVIITGALLAHSYVKRASQMHSSTIEMRNEASNHIRLLRSAMLDVERNLNAYLIHPDASRRERVQQSLQQAQTHQQRLYELEWFKNSNMAAELDDFGLDLKALSLTLQQLMESSPPIERHVAARETRLPLAQNTASNDSAQFISTYAPLSSPIFGSTCSSLTKNSRRWRIVICHCSMRLQAPQPTHYGSWP